jgi:hypothetical protein
VRRLNKWEIGDFNALMIEGRTIQKKMKEDRHHFNEAKNLPRKFARLMLKGQTTAAIRLLDKTESSGVLSLDENVIEELKKKHPAATNADPTIILDGDIPFVDPVMFHDLNESAIAKAVSRTNGAAGTSGMDADNETHHNI